MAGKTRAKRKRAVASADGDQAASSSKSPAPLPSALPPLVAATLVFIAAGAVLMLEILAVRLLAPYVGLTLETTTSIIGAALAGIAAGAAIGGWLADRTNPRWLIAVLLIGGGLLALLTVPIVRWLGPGARGDGDLAALGITVIALVPAAAMLSAVSPAVAHLQLHDLRASGTVVGKLSAWGTAGALIGTFGTGFVLVPLMPVSTAVLAIGIVLVIAGIVLGTSSRLLSAGVTAGAVTAAIVLGALAATFDSPCDTETKYHCVSVRPYEAKPVGYELLLDDVTHSYVDVSDPTHLEYAYTRWMADAIDATSQPGEPLDGVFVGGGGFTLPRWLIATRPGSSTQVLEVDGELVDVVEDRLGLRPSSDLRVSVGDARIEMLDVPSDSADLVVNDAFGHYAVPWHLATSEWFDEVKRVLRPGGLFALNLIDLSPFELAQAEAATLLDDFADVQFVTLPNEDGSLFGGNLVFLASDRPLPAGVGSSALGGVTYDREEVESFAGDAQTLRDDFAPTDQLLTSHE